MSDNMARHIIAGIGTLVLLLAYIAGYVSGTHGWFLTGVIVLGAYAVLYSLIDV